MSFDSGFWIGLQLLVGIHLITPLLLYMLYLIIGRKFNGAASVTQQSETDYAIIVTAYGQTDSLAAAVDSILHLRYANFLVYIVADNCDISALRFDDDRVVLLRPPEVLASNTRSHFYAMGCFVRPHERLTIIDSDNLVHPDYLIELDALFDSGFVAVQGLRKPKNLDTHLACLDAARDCYYHYYDAKLLFGSGSSATLAGSGMAFTTRLYRETIGHLDITGAGFDKVLQYEIVKRGHRIAFASKAIVYDEKTTQAAQLVNQRARWVNTWFKYVGFGFRLVGHGIRSLNVNQLLFGFTLLRPPLFVFLVGSVCCLLLSLFINPGAAWYWFLGILLFVLGFFHALRQSTIDGRIYRSLWQIPRFVYFQVISLMRAHKANKISVATRHSVVREISDIEDKK